MSWQRGQFQSQALIDLAFRMREKITDVEQIDRIVIHTSHHTHAVIGTALATIRR